MRSPRPWCFSHPTTAATSRERNCLWMAASHKCRPLIAEGHGIKNCSPLRTSLCHQPPLVALLRCSELALILGSVPQVTFRKEHCDG